MKSGLADYVTAIAQDKRRQRGRLNQELTVPHLEVVVERALQGSRRCRQCAAVHGQYTCIPSAAVRNEWRHSASALDLIVHLVTCQPACGPHLQAMILVKDGSRSHARVVYSGEPLTMELQGGPWTLKLISENTECDFAFPGQVEIVSSGKLLAPRSGVSICRRR